MKTLPLKFEELPPVVVRISPVPTREFLDIVAQADTLVLDPEAIDKLAAAFAPYVVSVDGKKTSAKALLELDFNQFLAVIRAWVVGVREVPLPLPLAPDAGEQ